MPDLTQAEVAAMASTAGLTVAPDDLVEVTHRLNAFLAPGRRYFRFRETTVTTKHLGEGIAADYDADGRLAGIEILDATVEWTASPHRSVSAYPSRASAVRLIERPRNNQHTVDTGQQ